MSAFVGLIVPQEPIKEVAEQKAEPMVEKPKASAVKKASTRSK